MWTAGRTAGRLGRRRVDGVGTHGFVLSEGTFSIIDVPGSVFTYVSGINAGRRYRGSLLRWLLPAEQALPSKIKGTASYRSLAYSAFARLRIGMLERQAHRGGSGRNVTFPARQYAALPDPEAPLIC